MQPEYAWISQETVVSSASVTALTSYDLLMTTNIDNTNPLTMMAGETKLFEAYIISTNPATNLEFEISELLGDDESLSFGRPSVKFGSAFRFSKAWPDPEEYDGRLLHLDQKLSNSGLSVRKRRWRIMGLLNAEATRNTASNDNKVNNKRSHLSFMDILFRLP